MIYHVRKTWAESNYWILLFVVSLVAFSGVWLRSVPFGFDSFASLSCVFGVECVALGNQPLAVFVLELLPDSLLAIKALSFICFFASISFVFLFVKRFFNKKVALIATFLTVALSPILLFRFGEIENELFAIPLLFCALWLITHQKNYLKIIATILLGIATLFWTGSIAYLPVLTVFFPQLIIILIIAAIFVFSKIISILSPQVMAVEQTLFGSVFQFFGWFLAFPFFAATNNTKILISGLIALGISVLLPSFMFLATPFVAFAFCSLIMRLNVNWTYFIVIISVFCLIGFNLALFWQEPTTEELILVDKMVFLSEKEKIPFYADFSYDYWIEFQTKKVLPYPRQAKKDWNNIARPFYGLTIEGLDCKFVSGTRDVNLYKC